MVVFHSFLILANVAIIFGGSYLAGADFAHPENGDLQRRLNIAKITRTSGQSVFLVCNFLLLFAILATIRGRKRAGVQNTHPTLILLLVAWFPLIVRGIFGILQAAIWSLSYYNRKSSVLFPVFLWLIARQLITTLDLALRPALSLLNTCWVLWLNGSRASFPLVPVFTNFY